MKLKLNEVKNIEQYHVEVSNGFAAVEDLDAEVDTTVLGKLLERIQKFQPESLLYYELKNINHGSMKDAQNY
jgi:hypothetical protein